LSAINSDPGDPASYLSLVATGAENPYAASIVQDTANGGRLSGLLKISSAEVGEAIEAVYRQLLGRQPLASEQLGDAESQVPQGSTLRRRIRGPRRRQRPVHQPPQPHGAPSRPRQPPTSSSV